MPLYTRRLDHYTGHSHKKINSVFLSYIAAKQHRSSGLVYLSREEVCLQLFCTTGFGSALPPLSKTGADLSVIPPSVLSRHNTQAHFWFLMPPTTYLT